MCFNFFEEFSKNNKKGIEFLRIIFWLYASTSSYLLKISDFSKQLAVIASYYRVEEPLEHKTYCHVWF
jgi:hypothetical protein